MPDQLSKIPLMRTTSEDVLEGNSFSKVVLSSAGTNWHNVVVEEHHFRTRELADLMFIQHVIAVNVGPLITCEFKRNGHFQHLSMPKGAISLSPSQRPFFRRSILDDNASADVLFLALDPVFVSQTAASLEVYPDRVELVEQQRQTDPALRHIALAFLRRHAGLACRRHAIWRVLIDRAGDPSLARIWRDSSAATRRASWPTEGETGARR